MSAGQDLAAFARAEVAPRRLDLIQDEQFPWPLWQEMGARGWLGFGMPDHGGIGVSADEMFDVAKGFAEAFFDEFPHLEFSRFVFVKNKSIYLSLATCWDF